MTVSHCSADKNLNLSGSKSWLAGARIYQRSEKRPVYFVVVVIIVIIIHTIIIS